MESNEKPGLKFAGLLSNRMSEMNLNRNDLAEKIKRSPEHVRKLVSGLAFPGPDLRERVAEVLQLPIQHIEKAVELDKWFRKYGRLPTTEVVKSDVPLLGKLWRELTEEQREQITCIARCMLRNNRRLTAKT